MRQGRKIVKEVDKDGDGRLNQEEREAARALLRKERAAGGRDRPGGPPGGPRGFNPGRSLAGAIVRRADANEDAKVTLDELVAALGSHFKEVDKDSDRNLDETELGAGVNLLTPAEPGFGPGGGFGRRENREPPKPGPRVAPADVKSYPDSSLYEPTVLRTLFLEFENKDWETELAEFHGTDVEVPATLTVDGKTYPHIGVHFRGMSSFGMVPAGYKRSLNLSLNFADPEQRLYGYRTLNLLNCHDDPSFMGTVLYSRIAQQYLPAPKANFVKVVINGESWGVYVNAQQFNKKLLSENFKPTVGTRWKARGSPRGGSGLEYLGDNIEDYKQRYEIKSGDDEKAWQALIGLCKTLNQTPAEKLEEALKPILDVDSLLWFLALDVALINNDGYWVRASDYSLFLDQNGKFHIIPYDMNEAFHEAMGFGGPGGRGRGGFGSGQSQPGEILPSALQETLSFTSEQKRQIAEVQKDVDGKVEKILSDDQKTQLKRLREAGPGDVFAGGGGPGGPGEFRGGFPGRPGEGPGGAGMGPRGPGVELDPLVGMDDERKPLRSRVLAVTSLRARYLQNVRAIAEEWLNWGKLGPIVEQYRSLLAKEIEGDTRKLESYEAFNKAVADVVEPDGGPPARGRRISLRAFVEGRSKYLLNHPEIKKAAAAGPKT